MGTFEKNLVFFVIRWFFRWLMSNEKNKQEEQKKKEES